MIKHMTGKSKHKQSGFTLIEILVAIVIVSVGLLGVAGMQGTTLRNTHSTTMRSQALDLARDMIERMRANHLAIKDGTVDYNHTLSAGATLTAPKDCNTSTCTATETRNYDIHLWSDAIQSRLPESSAAIVSRNIAFAGATAVKSTVTVNWREAGDEATDPLRTLSMDLVL